MTSGLRTAALSGIPVNEVVRAGDLVLLVVFMVSFNWLANTSGKCIFVDFNRDVECPLNVMSL